MRDYNFDSRKARFGKLPEKVPKYLDSSGKTRFRRGEATLQISAEVPDKQTRINTDEHRSDRVTIADYADLRYPLNQWSMGNLGQRSG